MTVTLQQLRRRISRQAGNLLLVTATGAGTTTTVVDTNHLRYPDSALVGREAYFASGTAGNVGLSRFITASSQASTSITFPAVTSSTAANDVVEIHNVRGSGWTVDEINAVIGDVLRDASDSLPNYDREDVAAAFDADAPTVTIPATFRAIYGVQWQDDNDLFHEVPAAEGPNGNGWWLYRNERELLVSGAYRSYADTRAIRLYGSKAYAALAADADTTTCNEEWLVQQALANLFLLGSERMGDGTRERRALYHQQQANQRRDLLVGPPPPDLVLV